MGSFSFEARFAQHTMWHGSSGYGQRTGQNDDCPGTVGSRAQTHVIVTVDSVINFCTSHADCAAGIMKTSQPFALQYRAMETFGPL